MSGLRIGQAVQHCFRCATTGCSALHMSPSATIYWQLLFAQLLQLILVLIQAIDQFVLHTIQVVIVYISILELSTDSIALLHTIPGD